MILPDRFPKPHSVDISSSSMLSFSTLDYAGSNPSDEPSMCHYFERQAFPINLMKDEGEDFRRDIDIVLRNYADIQDPDACWVYLSVRSFIVLRSSFLSLAAAGQSLREFNCRRRRRWLATGFGSTVKLNLDFSLASAIYSGIIRHSQQAHPSVTSFPLHSRYLVVLPLFEKNGKTTS